MFACNVNSLVVYGMRDLLVDFFIFRDDGGGPLMDGGAASGSSILQPLGASCGTPPRGEAGILVAGQVP